MTNGLDGAIFDIFSRSSSLEGDIFDGLLWIESAIVDSFSSKYGLRHPSCIFGCFTMNYALKALLWTMARGSHLWKLYDEQWLGAVTFESFTMCRAWFSTKSWKCGPSPDSHTINYHFTKGVTNKSFTLREFMYLFLEWPTKNIW